MTTKKKAKVRKLLIWGIIAIAVTASATVYLLRPKPLSYDSAVAQKGDITTNYTFSGNIEAKNRQAVVAERIIQVSKIYFLEGEKVKAGDVLIGTTTGEKIKAKINGEVANLEVDEGSQVMAGTKLMDIVDYDNLQIGIKVDEYDLPAVKPGKAATVRIEAIQKDLQGTVRSIAKEGSVVNGVTFFTAVIDPKKDQSLKIGMTADVTILNQKAGGVVTLPMTAIQFDANNKPYVLKMGANKAMVQTMITTGINNGQKAEIKQGVTEGETVYYAKITASDNFSLNSRIQGGQTDGGNT